MLDSIAVISHEMVPKIPVERITFGQRALTLLRATNRVLVTLESHLVTTQLSRSKNNDCGYPWRMAWL